MRFSYLSPPNMWRLRRRGILIFLNQRILEGAAEDKLVGRGKGEESKDSMLYSLGSRSEAWGISSAQTGYQRLTHRAAWERRTPPPWPDHLSPCHAFRPQKTNHSCDTEPQTEAQMEKQSVLNLKESGSDLQNPMRAKKMCWQSCSIQSRRRENSVGNLPSHLISKHTRKEVL